MSAALPSPDPLTADGVCSRELLYFPHVGDEGVRALGRGLAASRDGFTQPWVTTSHLTTMTLHGYVEVITLEVIFEC